MSDKNINLNKNLTGLSLESYIVDITSEGQNYCFYELLTHPHINTVKPRFVQIVKLFASGCLADYKDFENQFGPLNQKQILTLKKLTILTEFKGKNKILISSICKSIESSQQDFFSLILKMNIDGAIQIKIDQQNGYIIIVHSQPRKIAIESNQVAATTMKINEMYKQLYLEQKRIIKQGIN